MAGRPNTAWIKNRDWKIGEKIGAGAFGEVFKCLSGMGQLYAVKRLNMSNKAGEIKDLMSEIQLMSILSHKNIVSYIGAYVDANDSNVYIFQEWAPGGSIEGLLKTFGALGIGATQNYMRQVCQGLAYLHSKNIVHRDIKAGNILVDADTVKLADFGASTNFAEFDETQATTAIHGTPYFMAPEVLQNTKYGRKGDVWAVGCTLIQMMTAQPPWKDRNLKGIVQLHILLSTWEGPPPCSAELTPDAREFLDLCCRKKEADRPSAMELLETKFLRLDESANDYQEEVDVLSQTGVLRGLKLEMEAAAARTPSGPPSLGSDFAASPAPQVASRQGAAPIKFTAADRALGFKNVNNPYASSPNAGGSGSRDSGKHGSGGGHAAPGGGAAAAGAATSLPIPASTSTAADYREESKSPRPSTKQSSDDATINAEREAKLARNRAIANREYDPDRDQHHEADYKDDFEEETYDNRAPGRRDEAYPDDFEPAPALHHRENGSHRDAKLEGLGASHRGNRELDHDRYEAAYSMNVSKRRQPTESVAPGAPPSPYLIYDVDDDDDDYEVDPFAGTEITHTRGGYYEEEEDEYEAAKSKYVGGSHSPATGRASGGMSTLNSSARSICSHSSADARPAPVPRRTPAPAVGAVRKAPIGRTLGSSGTHASTTAPRPPRSNRTATSLSSTSPEIDNEFDGDYLDCEPWDCRKCGKLNTNPKYCDMCATTKQPGINLTIH